MEEFDIQELECTKCGCVFECEGPSECPQCDHVYTKWLNYNPKHQD